MGIPFAKIRGFRNCPPATSQIRNSLGNSKTSVITVEYCDLNGPLEIYVFIYFLL